MSLADSHFEAAAAHSQEFFGSTISIKPNGGSLVSITATVLPETTERRKNRDGGIDVVTVRHVIVDQSYAINSVVTISALTYNIETAEKGTDGRYTLKLCRANASEITRKNYRR